MSGSGESINAGTVVGKIVIDASQASTGTKQFQTSLDLLNKTVTENWWGLYSIGQTLGTLGGLATAAFSEATNAAGAWQAEMAQLNTTLNGAASGTQASQEQIQGLSDKLLQLAASTPTSVEGIAAIANEVAKVGVTADNIVAVTKNVNDLHNVTGASVADMTESIGRLTATWGLNADGIQRVTSTIFDLSRQTPSTASDIGIVAEKLDGLTNAYGLTKSEVLGLSSAVATVAPNNRTAATAINSLFQTIQKAVDDGGTTLTNFATLSGESADQFKKAFGSGGDGATETITRFITGLGQFGASGNDVVALLKTLGITGTSVTQILNALAEAQTSAGAGNASLSNQVAIANAAFAKGTDLLTAAQTQYGTYEARVSEAKNAVQELGISIGSDVLPVLKDATQLFSEWIGHITNAPPAIRDTILVLGGLGAAATIAGAAAFTLLPPLIQARAAYDALRNAATQYAAAQRDLQAGTLANVGYYNDLAVGADGLVTSTNSYIDSLNAQAVAAARTALELQNLANLEASLNALNEAAVAGDKEVLDATTAQTLAYEEQQAAIDALAAKASSLNDLTRNQLVSKASKSGVEGATKQTKPQLIDSLTSDESAAAATATSAATEATVASEAALANRTAVEKQATETQLQFNLAQAQATAAGTAFVSGMEAETNAARGFAAGLAPLNEELAALEATIIGTGDAEVADAATNTEELLGFYESIIVAAQEEAAEIAATSESKSQARKAAAIAAQAAALQEQAAAADTAQVELTAATAAREAAQLELAAKQQAAVEAQAVLEEETAASEAFASGQAGTKAEIEAQIAALTTAKEEAAAAWVAAEEAAAAATEAATAEEAAAMAVVTTAVDVATAEIVADLTAIQVAEDGVDFGLSSIIGLGVAAATVIPILLTLSGALDNSAKSAKSLAQANQQLESILQATGGALNDQTTKYVTNELAQNGALDSAKKLGIGYKELTDIVEGVASKSELDDFIDKTNKGGKAGADLKTVLDALAHSFYNSATAAREASAANTADGIASQDSAGQISQLAQATDSAGTSLDSMATAAQDLVGAEQSLKEAGLSVQEAQTNLTNAIKAQQNQWEDVAKASIDYQKALLDQQKTNEKLAEDQQTLADATATQAQETADAQKGLADAQTKLTDSYEKVTEAQQALNQAEDPTIALNAYLDAVNKLADAQNSLTDANSKVAAAQYQVNYLQKEGASQADIAAANNTLADATQKQTDAQQAVADASQNVTQVQIDNANKVQKAIDDLNTAMEDQQNDIQAVTDAQNKLAQAQQDAANNKDYNTALEQVQSDQLDVQSSALAVYDAQQKVNDANNEGTTLADNVAKAQNGVADAQLAYASAYQKVQQDLAESKGIPYTAVDSLNDYYKGLQQIGQNGPSFVQQYATQLKPIMDGINGTLAGAIAKSELPPTTADVAQAQKNLKALDQSVEDHHKTSSSTWDQIFTDIGHAAQAGWHFIDQYFVQPLGQAILWYGKYNTDFIGPMKNFFSHDIGDWANTGWQAVDNNFFHPIGSGANTVWQGFDQYIVQPIGHFFTIDLGSWVSQGLGFLEGIPGKISSFASGMWDGISGAFKEAINTIIGLWDGFVKYLKIPGFTIGVGPVSYHFGGFDLGKDLNIPYLAEGGIVPATSGGTLVLAGEGGEDEAIVPLSKLQEIINEYARENVAANTLPSFNDSNTGAGSNVGSTQASSTPLALASQQTSLAQAVQQLQATQALTTALTTSVQQKTAATAVESASHKDWLAAMDKLDASMNTLTQAVEQLEAGDQYTFHEVQATAQDIIQEISWAQRINTRS